MVMVKCGLYWALVDHEAFYEARAQFIHKIFALLAIGSNANSHRHTASDIHAIHFESFLSCYEFVWSLSVFPQQFVRLWKHESWNAEIEVARRMAEYIHLCATDKLVKCSPKYVCSRGLRCARGDEWHGWEMRGMKRDYYLYCINTNNSFCSLTK